MSANGKGDRQRPAQVTPEQLAERWARTFGGMRMRRPSHLILHTDTARELGLDVDAMPVELEPKPEGEEA